MNAQRCSTSPIKFIQLQPVSERGRLSVCAAETEEPSDVYHQYSDSFSHHPAPFLMTETYNVMKSIHLCPNVVLIIDRFEKSLIRVYLLSQTPSISSSLVIDSKYYHQFFSINVQDGLLLLLTW